MIKRIVVCAILPAAFTLTFHPLLAAAQTASDPTSSIEWADCPFNTTELDTERLRCGYLTVPVNRSKANGRTFRLAVGVLKSGSPNPRLDAVVFLSGGPGGHALRPALFRFFGGLFPDRDFVVYNPRGTGFSEPDMCVWLNATQRYVDALDLSVDEADLMMSGALRACRDELAARGVDFEAFGLSEEAADLEALRRALGYEQWNLLGISWGAMVAQAAVRDYPHGIRSLALVSPAPMGGLDEVAEAKLPIFASTLHELFAACGANAGCGASYPDLKNEFYGTIKALRQDPLVVPADMGPAAPDHYVVNGYDFVAIIRQMIFDEGKQSVIPAAIRTFSSRDVDQARKLVETEALRKTQMSVGKYFTSLCYNIPASQAEWESAASSYPALRSVGSWMEVCPYWHDDRASAAEVTPSKSDIPALVLSGGLDPVIPAESGEGILAVMPNAYQVVFPTAAHGPGPRSFPCIEQLLKRFITDPSSPPDTSCVSEARRIFADQGPDAMTRTNEQSKSGEG